MFDDFSFRIPQESGGGEGGIPDGGTTGQVLTKESNADGDAGWENVPNELPPGGNIYTSLSKLSNADGDFDWVLPYTPIAGANVSITGTYPSIVINAVNNQGGGGGVGSSSNDNGVNFVHNSNFWVRDLLHENVDIPAGLPLPLHANRWFMIASSWGEFESILSADKDKPYLTIRRKAGTTTETVRLVQILDTEDSINLQSGLSLIFDHTEGFAPSHYGGIGAGGIVVTVTAGHGINESLESYLAGTWTGQEVKGQIVYDAGSGGLDHTSWQRGKAQVQFNDNGEPLFWTQVAIEFNLTFIDNGADFAHQNFYLRNVLLTDYVLTTEDKRQDWKSSAIVKKECDRYAQRFDAYLTQIPQNFKIDMRDIPIISFEVGDTATFTTTGTTKDSLIISVDNVGDVGIHTIYLNAEL